MHGRHITLVLILACALAPSWACSTQRKLLRPLPTEPEDTLVILDVDAGGVQREPVSTDPHALLGVEPAVGPYSGGQLVLLRGNGFSSEMRVWFAGAEVPKSSVLTLDPNRLQVRVPAGAVGPCDVSVQRADEKETRRTLLEGYRYDSFFVEPGTGPVQGGTRITLTGQGNDWTEQTRVAVDLQVCEVLDLRELDDGVQELDCQTPRGTPGAKIVTTQNAALSTEARGGKNEADAAADGGSPTGPKVSVAGAFSYVESETGFAGGLSGKALTTQLDVSLLDSILGEPLPGVLVGLATATEPEQLLASDEDGVAHFEGELGPTQDITVAGPCLQPITVFDVPVDHVTLYVDPVLSPDCISLAFSFPGILGGRGGSIPTLKRVQGVLTWGTGVELKQTSWVNVPLPLEDEVQVAYLFELARSADTSFSLPSTIDAVLTDMRGSFGYPFDYYTRSEANITLYALAGIEQRKDGQRRFTPYAMGIERGIVPGNEELQPVIEMNIVFDHTVSVEVEAPKPAETGPDRVNVALSLRVGRTGFIPLPTAFQSERLPLSGAVEFRGVPPLINGLEGSEYVARAEAVTGDEERLPLANVEARARSSGDAPIEIDGFIGIPQFERPTQGTRWNGSRITLGEVAGDFDLWSLRVDAGDLFSWRLVAPRERTELALPKLALFGAALPTGPLTIRASAARITDFDFAHMTQETFTSSGWSAYSANIIAVQVP